MPGADDAAAGRGGIRLGVDIGGVLKPHRTPETEPRFVTSLQTTEPVPGSLETLRRLASGGFGPRLWVVSKCRAENEEPLRAWLGRNGFLDDGLVLLTDVHFCRERADKAEIARHLRLSHFVDDRPEVMSHMDRAIHRVLFQPDRDDAAAYAASIGGVPMVETWDDVAAALLATLSDRVERS